MVAISNKYTLTEILSKEQYRIKLAPSYYFFSLHNVIVGAICFLVIDSFLFSMSVYLLLSMFVFRYVFSMTKDGNQYDVLVLKYFIKIAIMTRNKTRIRERILEH